MVAPVSDTALDFSDNRRRGDAAAVVAGPRTVGSLIDMYLEACKTARSDHSSAELSSNLERRIAATRLSSFLTAILEHAETSDVRTISVLAYLIGRHEGHESAKIASAVPTEQMPCWISILRSWAEAMIASTSSHRYDLCEVGNAIGRFGQPELVSDLKRLVDEDLARLRNALNGFAEAQRRGDIEWTSHASMRYGSQYRTALARIGGENARAVAATYLEDRIFGLDAAIALKEISDKELNIQQPDFFRRRWPWSEKVANARAKRAAAFDRKNRPTITPSRLLRQLTDWRVPNRFARASFSPLIWRALRWQCRTRIWMR